jgi:hypothetical protein
MSSLSRNSIRSARAATLLVCLLLLAQLACISMEFGIKVIPEGPDSGMLDMTITYRLTDEYVQAARQANQDLAADYAAANLAPPDSLFPESLQEMEEKPDFSEMLGPDYQIVSETDTEMVATGTKSYGPGTDMEEAPVTAQEDENGWTHYLMEMDLPEMADQETLDSLDTARAEGLGPKPEAAPPSEEPAEGGGGLMGFMGLFQEIGSEMSEGMSLEAWYMERLLLDVGLPSITYRIEMPGPIQSHTIDGRPGGTLDESGRVFTLVLDEAFSRQYGPGAHRLVLDSVVHPCEAECNTGPHWTWDGASDADNCGCICENGWQPDANGDCVACDEVCRALDPRAVADPAESGPNSCACRCDSPLMAWEPGGGCICTVGAEPDGDGCSCKDGWELNADGSSCIPAAPTPEAGTPKPTSCEIGMTCYENPDLCPCYDGKICDAWSPSRDTFGCSPKVAVFAVSPEVSNYERWWISGKMKRIQEFYRAQGYEVRVVEIKSGDELPEALGNPSTRALAYFGHARTPTLESSDADGIQRAVHGSLLRRYRQQGMNQQEATEAASQRAGAPNLDYAYIHTCHSLDDNSLRDYLVKPGGTYWGKEGLLWAFQDPVQSVRPE